MVGSIAVVGLFCFHFNSVYEIIFAEFVCNFPYRTKTCKHMHEQGNDHDLRKHLSALLRVVGLFVSTCLISLCAEFPFKSYLKVNIK